MPKARREKGWVLGDDYARKARGEDIDSAEGLGSSRVYVAARDFAHFVMPTLDGFDIRAEVDAEADFVRDKIFGHRHDLWGNEISLSMAIHQTWVQALLQHRDIYLYIDYDRNQTPAVAVGLHYLAPETIEPRRLDGRRCYEQHISGHAAYTEGRERWFTFDSDEMIHLRWPLTDPRGRGAPVQIARRTARSADRLGEMTLLATQAFATPDDTFLPLVRARHGAYFDVLERLEDVEDAAGDVLFFPPERHVTDFFWADRFARAKAAGAQVRDYIVGELNHQWLQPWRALNDWDRIELVFVPELFTAADWRKLRSDLHGGRATPEDLWRVAPKAGSD